MGNGGFWRRQPRGPKGRWIDDGIPNKGSLGAVATGGHSRQYAAYQAKLQRDRRDRRKKAVRTTALVAGGAALGAGALYAAPQFRAGSAASSAAGSGSSRGTVAAMRTVHRQRKVPHVGQATVHNLSDFRAPVRPKAPGTMPRTVFRPDVTPKPKPSDPKPTPKAPEGAGRTVPDATTPTPSGNSPVEGAKMKQSVNSKRSEAAKKAAETRRKNKAEADAAAKKRSEAAKKAAETRRKNKAAAAKPDPVPEPKPQAPKPTPKAAPTKRPDAPQVSAAKVASGMQKMPGQAKRKPSGSKGRGKSASSQEKYTSVTRKSAPDVTVQSAVDTYPIHLAFGANLARAKKVSNKKGASAGARKPSPLQGEKVSPDAVVPKVKRTIPEPKAGPKRHDLTPWEDLSQEARDYRISVQDRAYDRAGELYEKGLAGTQIRRRLKKDGVI